MLNFIIFTEVKLRFLCYYLSMQLVKKIFNILDNYFMYYIELSLIILVISLHTYLCLTFFLLIPDTSYLGVLVLMAVIATAPYLYAVILLLAGIHCINRFFFDKHIPFDKKFPKWYKIVWRINLFINACFQALLLSAVIYSLISIRGNYF